MRAARSTLLLLCLVSAGPLACGGGGSSNPTSLLTGSYHLVGIDARTDGGPQATTTWGTLTADGVGTLVLTASRNEEGNTTGPDTETGIPYAVSGDRTVTVFDAVQPTLAVAVGRVTPQGDVAVLGSGAADRDPGLWIAVRKGGSFSPTALAGTYHGCMLRHRASPEDHITYAGTYTLDTLGAFSAIGRSNVDGAAGIFTQNGTYSVSPDGEVNVSIGVLDLSGGALAGGGLAVLAGSTFYGTEPVLMVLIRSTPVGETWEIPRGGNFIAGLERDVVGNVYRSYFGSFTVGATVDITVQWTRNEEGVLSALAAWSSTWAADPDASFGFYDAEGDYYGGGLDQGGRFGVMAGGRDALSNPGFFFLVR